MDYKKLGKHIKQNVHLHIGILLACILAGILAYYLPEKYIATGTLLVQRAPETATDYFTYEGFYSQQTAQLFTNTVVGLLESVDIRAKAMENIGIPVNEVSLKRTGKYIKVNKTGPQLIALTVKGNTPTAAENMWNALSSEILSKISQLNSSGDSNLKIVQVYQTPLLSKQYKSMAINIMAGVLFAGAISLLYVSFKYYD